MNDRSLAIHDIAKRSRSLSERLTQRIVEAREEIEADAEGGSYLSEIETIYDQLGSRLAHVNGMLANLPPAAEHRRRPTPRRPKSSMPIWHRLHPTGFELEVRTPPTDVGTAGPRRVATSAERTS